MVRNFSLRIAFLGIVVSAYTLSAHNTEHTVAAPFYKKKSVLAATAAASIVAIAAVVYWYTKSMPAVSPEQICEDIVEIVQEVRNQEDISDVSRNVGIIRACSERLAMGAYYGLGLGCFDYYHSRGIGCASVPRRTFGFTILSLIFLKPGATLPKN